MSNAFSKILIEAFFINQISSCVVVTKVFSKSYMCCSVISILIVGNSIIQYTSVKFAYIVVSGRLKQLIELNVLDTSMVRMFVLDEADKLIEEGSFQKQIK